MNTKVTSAGFKLTFRFTRDNFAKLLRMVGPSLNNATNRGRPLSPTVQLQVTLFQLGGQTMQRVCGNTFGISQSSARLCMKRVCEAILPLRNTYLLLPGDEEQHATAAYIRDHYHINDVIAGIDGVHMSFREKPRGRPEGMNPQEFWCRKQRWSVNVSIIGNEKRILDVDAQNPGNVHDSNIYQNGRAREFFEGRGPAKILADSAYKLSETLMKPFLRGELAQGSVQQQNRKKLFNRRQSAARTIMTRVSTDPVFLLDGPF